VRKPTLNLRLSAEDLSHPSGVIEELSVFGTFNSRYNSCRFLSLMESNLGTVMV